MTVSLVGSIITPDGIIIAGDSLATLSNTLRLIGTMKAACTSCGKDQEFTGDLHCPPLPQSTFPFSQKVFPFLSRYAVGTVGIGQLEQKTIHFLLRQLEHELLNTSGKQVDYEFIVSKIKKYLHDKIKQCIPDIEKASDDWAPLGIQIVGYSSRDAVKSTPKVTNLNIGKKVFEQVFESIGDYWSGQLNVVNVLKGLPNAIPAFGVFSLQDAIDYANYIIGTTAQSQRFSSQLPNVGGNIDIALITPFEDFRWIKCKEIR